MNITTILNQYTARINHKLESLFINNFGPPKLHSAIKYALLNGGKRLRPTLVYIVGETFGADLETLDNPACAIELIHAYSLIHDDLPAMDNADLRRGLPSCHKAFDEATAILAGDALLPLAFELLSEKQIAFTTSATVLRMIAELSIASGAHGMVGGQILDLFAGNEVMTVTHLETIYYKKTSALLAAAAKLGALAANCTKTNDLNVLENYAVNLGLAFQIQDDILDIEGKTEVTGKKQGKDAEINKITYPALTGIDAAKNKIDLLIEEAIDKLTLLENNTTLLRDFALFMRERNY